MGVGLLGDYLLAVLLVAWMTWSKRQVTVRGPTPPSFGVIAFRSSRERTSSDTSPFKTPSSEAVPASTMVAPAATISEVISPGLPVAVMITS